jgi:23S rRNA pseudouridine2457 synthase
VYPAGRLDADSEGLLLLTDDGRLQARLSSPRFKLPKTYWAQVEGEAKQTAVDRLLKGVELRDGPARAASASLLADPGFPPRVPPIRVRKAIPTSWIEIVLDEGRNRQVRRMTAAVGLPTLRLVRVAVGPYQLGDIPPGGWRRGDTALLN